MVLDMAIFSTSDLNPFLLDDTGQETLFSLLELCRGVARDVEWDITQCLPGKGPDKLLSLLEPHPLEVRGDDGEEVDEDAERVPGLDPVGHGVRRLRGDIFDLAHGLDNSPENKESGGAVSAFG